jgi:hypothetical protein
MWDITHRTKQGAYPNVELAKKKKIVVYMIRVVGDEAGQILFPAAKTLPS